MGIQPAALTFVGTKGEEILEDAPVRDDAADQRHQHGYASNADHPKSRLPRMQPIVEIHKMVAALGGAHDAMSWQRLSGSGIQLCRGVLALFIEPVHTQVAGSLGIRGP